LTWHKKKFPFSYTTLFVVHVFSKIDACKTPNTLAGFSESALHSAFVFQDFLCDY
jgi:hypothetical protein